MKTTPGQLKDFKYSFLFHSNRDKTLIRCILTAKKQALLGPFQIFPFYSSLRTRHGALPFLSYQVCRSKIQKFLQHFSTVGQFL